MAFKKANWWIKQRKNTIDRWLDVIKFYITKAQLRQRRTPHERRRLAAQRASKNIEKEEREQIKQGQEPLMEMMKQLMEEMKQLREENRGVKKELQTINGILEREREKWKQKERSFEERINNLEKKVEIKERQERRNNFIITGMEIRERTDAKEVEEFLKKEIEAENREQKQGKRRGKTRKSKDKVENKDGKLLWELIEERGWELLNGVKEGDEEEEFTWIGKRGESVIDYVIVNGLAEEEVETFKIGERVDSDHVPLEVKYINKERKNKITISEDIPIIQWKKHFIKLLNGKEERIVVQDSKTGIGGREREAEIRVEEVAKQLGKLKRGKAPGRDGLVNEVWIFGTDGMIERLSELMNDVWTGKGFPRGMESRTNMPNS
ncbi:trichohyalin-like [Zophobas morio]|uniref:trichohyalin-like n=1 Tax=Zophobas morio TaxID=2755281 RepID=UPI0030836E73